MKSIYGDGSNHGCRGGAISSAKVCTIRDLAPDFEIFNDFVVWHEMAAVNL